VQVFLVVVEEEEEERRAEGLGKGEVVTEREEWGGRGSCGRCACGRWPAVLGVASQSESERGGEREV
jgi:hypothetical protein